ncbi:MAG: hypothetical protein ACUVXA_12165 [Candidatus Jordarchaeum sp.]|uniref:hypothetical protein n=1 Tax=Candidatus Jordarchaeum sp. TaxID=2823881 RepID=UPI00404A7311
MTKSNLPDLEQFAREIVGAESYPDDVHIYVEAGCDKCGVVPFEVTVEHWNGDSPVDFHGKIWLKCSVCGEKQEYLYSLLEGSKLQYIEECRCKCDSAKFFVASCDRIEVWDDQPSFYDEGVVVGKCSVCGSIIRIAMTD